MFSKSFLVAFLYLSVVTSVFARPATNDFHLRSFQNSQASAGNSLKKGGANAKGNTNTETCGTGGVTTVTVTAAAAAAATSGVNTAATTGGKGGNNANKGGAAGNNNGTGNSSAASSSSAAAASTTSTASATAASSAASGTNDDAQTTLTLDPKVLATGFENNGQDVPTAGQVASLTSSNNFINFCLTVPNLPITNGQQIKTGSCNPAPMGALPATSAMPSSKFQFPTNGAVIKANTAFTINMAIANLETGLFTNAQENYYSAPQQLNAQGQIRGHSHFVIEAIDSFASTKVTDPNVFAFFKGVNTAAVNGVLSTDVTAGLPAGTYRLASINAAMNHQPLLAPIAQHGSMDDMVYFTVTADGQAAAGSDFGGASANSTATTAASTTAAAAASSAAAATTTATGKAAGGFKGGKGGKN